MAHPILAGPCNEVSYDAASTLRIFFNALCVYPADMSIDMFAAFLRLSLILLCWRYAGGCVHASLVID